MRICIVNPFYDAVSETYLEVTGRYRHVERLAAALAKRGHEVTVVQALQNEALERRESVTFRYAKASQRSAFRLSGGVLGIELLWPASLSNVVAALEEVQPDAVHINGVTLLQPLALISAWCERKKLPLTVSHHGGSPRRLPWLRAAHRRALSRCSGAYFTSEEHAEPWISAGVLRNEKVIVCMEVSSTFSPTNRTSARERTGMHGAPVFVWNAGLHKRKDPLTALKGFSLIRQQWTEARLYMIYISDEMLLDVQQAIADDPHLAGSVEMRGIITPDAVEDFLNSADIIIQSSVSEFSGYSILEAMACGVVPVVSDIPSFRAMTAAGQYGLLFPVGDYRRMAEGVLALDRNDLRKFSDEGREFFVRELSYDAIARTYERTLMLSTLDGAAT